MSDTPKTIEVIRPCPQCLMDWLNDDETIESYTTPAVGCVVGMFLVEGHEGAEVIKLTEETKLMDVAHPEQHRWRSKWENA